MGLSGAEPPAAMPLRIATLIIVLAALAVSALGLQACVVSTAAATEIAEDDTGAQHEPLFDDAFDEAFDQQHDGFPDPFEGINRAVLDLNGVIDKLILDPLTRAYGFVVPDPMKRPVRRAFQHYGTPSILLNDVLQWRFRDAGVAVVRFAANTTTGVGGLFDFARCGGLERRHADFGQTLAFYHVPSGPYLVLPLFGPSTARDAVGDVVDGLLHPARYVLGPIQQLTYGGGAGLSTREAYYLSLSELKKSSVDFYAALRNAYYQARIAEIERKESYLIATGKVEEERGRCPRTLEGHRERVIGPPPALGRAASPVSRWRRTRSP